MSPVQKEERETAETTMTKKVFWPMLSSILGMLLLAMFIIPSILKSHAGLLSAGTLLSLAIIFYVGGSALYVSYLLRRVDPLVQVAKALVLIAFLFHTGAIVAHWIAVHRPPISNIFEMLISFAWALIAMDYIFQRVYKLKILSSFCVPIATLSVLLSTILPTDPNRTLPPALQSVWLYIHVTFAIFSYVACAIAFVASILYLIKDRVKLATFGLITQALNVATLIGIDWLGNADNAHHHFNILFRGEFYINLLYKGRDIAIPEMEKTFLVAPLPWVGQILRISLLISVVGLIFYLLKVSSKKLIRVTQAGFLMHLISVVALVVAIMTTTMQQMLDRIPTQVLNLFDTAGLAAAATVNIKSNPFTLAGILVAIVTTMLFLVLNARHESIISALPETRLLDEVNYKVVTIAFPLLTLMIATGAFWANRTWGSYWNWDPKEVGALITWLVYAAYLHMRIVRGWAGRRAAYFAIIGFILVLFTFIGISYLLPGLHAYA
jgi:cytochrome c-type biogenesis protein CcsB